MTLLGKRIPLRDRKGEHISGRECWRVSHNRNVSEWTVEFLERANPMSPTFDPDDAVRTAIGTGPTFEAARDAALLKSHTNAQRLKGLSFDQTLGLFDKLSNPKRSR